MASSGPLSVHPSYYPIPRTVLSVNVFGDSEYEIEPNTDTRWLRVTSNVNWVGDPHRLWASVGSCLRREKILFDENDPRIQALKDKAIAFCQRRPIIETLQYVCNLVNGLTIVPNESLQVTEQRLDREIEELLKESHKAEEQIYFRLGDLITQRKLICRHKGLISAAILRTCVEQKILPFGTVRQYRSTLENGSAHTWSVYRDFSTGHLWICDPRWRIADNVSLKVYDLALKYSPAVLSCMMQRLDVQDIYVRLASQFSDIVGLPFSFELRQSAQQSMTLCCRFQSNGKTLTALRNAFQKQGIVSSHSDTAIFISMIQVKALLNLDVEKLLNDYRDFCQLSPAEILRQAVFQAMSQQPRDRTVFFSVSSISLTTTPPGTPFNFIDVEWSESLNTNESVFYPR